MALTIRMRIDENDEHSYYYATGDGTEIELIPLVVDSNGVYTPDENKAYNRVTVNVPETELEELVVTTNDVYNAPSGKAYNVVRVNVQPILEAVSRSYTVNGTYTIEPSEGSDGISSVSVVVDVPTPTPELQSKTETYTANGSYTVTPDSGYDGLSGVDVEVNVPATPTPSIQASKSQTITQNGTVTVSPDSGYDAMEEAEITVNVPTGGTDYLAKRLNQNVAYEYESSEVTEIGKEGFRSDARITKVKLPNCTYVGRNAFRGSINLESAYFGAVTAFGTDVFYECTSLETVVISGGSTVPTISPQAFSYATENLKIYVPDALVNNYKSATNWSSYASKIFPISEYVEN